MKQMPSAYNKKRILSLWLCLTLLLTVLLPVSAFAAVSGKKVVRVGWFESTFNMTDQNGRRSGYAYEYQQKIAAYTGWEYQYVTASWPQLLEMLKQGEIDMLSDVSYTQERTQSMLYSSLPAMIDTEYIFHILKFGFTGLQMKLVKHNVDTLHNHIESHVSFPCRRLNPKNQAILILSDRLNIRSKALTMKNTAYQIIIHSSTSL